MKDEMKNEILHDHNNDGIDRRHLLKCMAWVGTGLVWGVKGGVLSSRVFGAETDDGEMQKHTASNDFTFVQISDSHIGFSKEPNKDVVATFRRAIDRINALPTPPALLIHTGDLTHLSKPSEFDTVSQMMKSAKS